MWENLSVMYSEEETLRFELPRDITPTSFNAFCDENRKNIKNLSSLFSILDCSMNILPLTNPHFLSTPSLPSLLLPPSSSHSFSHQIQSSMTTSPNLLAGVIQRKHSESCIFRYVEEKMCQMTIMLLSCGVG